MENTKEYVCKAVVAVVDHLGSVSANLDHHISEAETDTITQTEVKIDLVKQVCCYFDVFFYTILIKKVINHFISFWDMLANRLLIFKKIVI